MCLVQLRAETRVPNCAGAASAKESTAMRVLRMKKKKFFQFRGAPY
jgi:hypothetical protein